MKVEKRTTLKVVSKFLPRRRAKSNKTDGGKSLIFAGKAGMWGAAILAARACGRSGAGYVVLAVDEKKIPIHKIPQVIIVDRKKIKAVSGQYDAVGVGPGLGVSENTKKIIIKLRRESFKNVVLDADALNVCALKKLQDFPKTWILTPHEGELSRLLNVAVQKIKKDRLKYASEAAKKFKCIIVLKGHKTLVAQEDNVYEIQTGNKALAKAGTGDVLTGMITAFLAQGLKPLHAALLGATLHGFLGDLWIKSSRDYLGLLATDLIDLIPLGLKKVRQLS